MATKGEAKVSLKVTYSSPQRTAPLKVKRVAKISLVQTQDKPRQLRQLGKAASTVRTLTLSSMSSTKSPSRSLNCSKSDIPKSPDASPNKSFPKTSKHDRRLSIPQMVSPRAAKSPVRSEELKFPMAGLDAQKALKGQLSPFESSEIAVARDVYFVGLQAAKVRPTAWAGDNFGFDDDKGDYRVVLTDHINYRYEVLELLGKGSFGQVLRVWDHKNQCESALKVIKSHPTFHDQAQREVRILQFLRDRDSNDEWNVVRLHDSFVFRRHVCMTFEMLGTNLYEYLKNNTFQGLHIGVIRRVALQVVTCLRAIHRCGVVHCDIKPENLLFRPLREPALKVIDFGSACFMDEKPHGYIQSLYYRAPELVLGLPFSSAVDLWALGCVLVELRNGLPLFPAETDRDLLRLITDACGPPPGSMLESVQKITSDRVRNAPEAQRPASGLRNILRNADDLFASFVESKRYAGCLQWDPTQRITAEDALNHEWLRTEAAGQSKPSAKKTSQLGLRIPADRWPGL